MSQYRTGTVTVTHGSAVVTGSGTAFLANAAPGDLFSIEGSYVSYEIGSVDSDTQITLTSQFALAGSPSSAAGQTYLISTSFTSQGIPYPEHNDVDPWTIFKQAMLMIDESITVIGGLTPTANAVIIGNGAAFVTAGPATLAALLSDFFVSTEGSLAFQPLDSDLTAIAQLGTQSFGRSLLTLGDTADLANLLADHFVSTEGSLAFQPLDSDLTAIAAQGTQAFGRALLTLGDTADLANLLADFFVSTEGSLSFQPLDPDLTAIAALATQGYGRSLLTQGSAAETRATLGLDYDAIVFVFDGGGSVIAANTKIRLWVPWDCTIYGWELGADTNGEIDIDIWKDTYANYPPTAADSITGADRPIITGSPSTNKAQDDNLGTGWNAVLSRGDWLIANVNSCNAIKACTLVLKVRK